jgi:FkbM family methyltransferase
MMSVTADRQIISRADIGASIPVGPVVVDLLMGDRIVDKYNRDGKWEPDTLAYWAEAVRPGTKVVDVGGYNGIFSIAAAKLGANPLTVEPMINLVRLILRNSKLNNASLHVVHAAATDYSGEVTLHYTDVPYTAGCSVERKSGNVLTVRAVTLDELKITGECSAMKIDVEGHEMKVLAGAKKLLELKPKLIVEVLTPEARRGVTKVLRTKGYKEIAFLDTRNLIMEPIGVV